LFIDVAFLSQKNSTQKCFKRCVVCCAGFMENRYYKNEEEQVFAVAEAMREEYEAIVAAGFQVQIDDPRFAMHYMLAPDQDVAQARMHAGELRCLHALRHISRQNASATTPAMASTWDRAPATWK
jgi:methionine synthase II (cobalamin-independent)